MTPIQWDCFPEPNSSFTQARKSESLASSSLLSDTQTQLCFFRVRYTDYLTVVCLSVRIRGALEHGTVLWYRPELQQPHDIDCRDGSRAHPRRRGSLAPTPTTWIEERVRHAPTVKGISSLFATPYRSALAASLVRVGISWRFLDRPTTRSCFFVFPWDRLGRLGSNMVGRPVTNGKLHGPITQSNLPRQARLPSLPLFPWPVGPSASALYLCK
ncbi:hypothetical protein B0T17DRAFT_269655 [Bombardia bombarda]|uniref:Uncharacterized protein n=1 Tax=Bombardia bombarda TaxID=252184 RepID=A0AA39X141_9PEZI|nr:hypothetical protein B0T17DRAFT_269655 [Bombardia bombarda]